MKRRRVLIMGAGGRDFHNFNVVFRDNPDYEVVGFTATQIPYIEDRIYPPELAGKLYPEGIPIYPEEKLEELIKEKDVDLVVFSYSDVSHTYVMNRGSRANASGADFILLGPKQTMLKSRKPVISVTAMRTGAGKSPIARYLAKVLRREGFRVGIIRHPMAYGDLLIRRVMRLESIEDLDKYDLTIEEKEDIEPHLINGFTVYIGVDYQEVLSLAEEESYIILWDGGNNDYPFIEPDISVVAVDPYRWEHIDTYYPGEVNVRMADIIVITKVNTAPADSVEKAEEKVKEVNPDAVIIKAGIKYALESRVSLKGKKVIVVEDGPTTTHGEMGFGAAYLLAKEAGAEIIDPRPYAIGSYREVYSKYSHLKEVIPALGYSPEQMRELEEFLNKIEEAEAVVSATPTRIARYLRIKKPIYQVTYELDDIGEALEKEVLQRLTEKIGVE